MYNNHAYFIVKKQVSFKPMPMASNLGVTVFFFFDMRQVERSLNYEE